MGLGSHSTDLSQEHEALSKEQERAQKAEAVAHGLQQQLAELRQEAERRDEELKQRLLAATQDAQDAEAARAADAQQVGLLG